MYYVVKMYDLKVRKSIQRRVKEILDARETSESIYHHLKFEKQFLILIALMMEKS